MPPIAKKSVGVFPRHPPLLAAQLAGELRRAGHHVQVLDAFAADLGVEETSARLAAEETGLVILMPNDVARETPREVTLLIAREYRRAGGSALVIVAGVGAEGWLRSLCRDAPQVDAGVLGDPELSVVAIADLLEAGKDWRVVPGAMGRWNNFTAIQAAVVEDLDVLGLPAWDLVGLARYVVLPHRKGNGIEYPILASRGCPWNKCEFCQDLACVKSPLFRVRSPESVVKEMKDAGKRFGARHFLFHDATFPTDRDWLERFVHALSDAGVVATWFCMTRADLVDAEKLALMRKAGCVNVCFGLESGSEEMLALMNKGHGLEASRNAVKLAKGAGLEVSATFVFGFPGETVEMARRTIELAVELRLDYAQFLLVKWHQVPTRFLGMGHMHEEWDLSQYDYRGMVFVPESYRTIGRLKFVRSYAYARFYLRPAYLLKAVSKIRSWNDVKRQVLGGYTLLHALLNR